MKPEILFEDEYLIACVKPCGVPAQGDKSNDEDMISILKNYLFDKSDSDEEPYLAAIHRLDRPVGGIMIFAKTEEAAAALSDQIQDGTMVKYYQAILTGNLPDFEGEVVNYMVSDSKTNTSKIVSKGTKGAKKAELFYEVLDEFETDDGPLTYVLIELITGRHHQIRCQMANLGAGIWGDTKYNPVFRTGGDNNGQGKNGQGKNGQGQGKNGQGKNGQKGGQGKNGNGKGDKKGPRSFKEIGLFASRLEFTHPKTGEEMVVKCEPFGMAFDAIELEEDLD